MAVEDRPDHPFEKARFALKVCAMSFLHSLLRRSASPAGKSEATQPFRLNGETVDILVRRHDRAVRIKLSVDAAKGMPVLTLPRHVSDREGQVFVEKNAGWLRSAMARVPDAVPLSHGSIVPVRGTDTRIDHRPDGRGVTRIDGDALIVTGDAAHTARRVTDFLKRQARADLTAGVREKAAILGRTAGRITVRDTRTRWGSCAANGDLSFSWRLILTPPEILDYVVSHEVAHLVHMDHSPAFWRTVARLDPDYEDHRDWLYRNGNALHRIG